MAESLLGLSEEIVEVEIMLARAQNAEAIGDDKELNVAMAELREWLLDTEAAWEQKIDAYVIVYRTCLAREKARKEEARHLQDMARADKAMAERLKERVRLASRMLGRKKLVGEKRTITVSEGGFSVAITQPSLLANKWWRVIPETREPDKKGIQAHIRDTGEIPTGVETFPTERVLFR